MFFSSRKTGLTQGRRILPAAILRGEQPHARCPRHPAFFAAHVPAYAAREKCRIPRQRTKILFSAGFPRHQPSASATLRRSKGGFAQQCRATFRIIFPECTLLSFNNFQLRQPGGSTLPGWRPPRSVSHYTADAPCPGALPRPCRDRPARRTSGACRARKCPDPAGSR